MQWVRIDNRLVHGQIIEVWLPYTDAEYLLVVNDDLARDPLRQQIISLAVPDSVRICFMTLAQLGDMLAGRVADGNIFILVADCADALALHEMGLVMTDLNVGNLHYAPGKRRILPHVAVSEEDLANLKKLEQCNVRLDFRCTPTEAERSLHDIFA